MTYQSDDETCPCNENNQCYDCQDQAENIELGNEKIRLTAIDNKLRNQRTLLLEKLCSVEIAIMLNNQLMEKLQ